MTSTCSLTIASRHIYCTVNDIQGHNTETSKYSPATHSVSHLETTSYPPDIGKATSYPPDIGKATSYPPDIGKATMVKVLTMGKNKWRGQRSSLEAGDCICMLSYNIWITNVTLRHGCPWRDSNSRTFRATREHSTASPIGISHLASQVGISHHYARSHISPPELTSSRGHSDSICDCHFIHLPPETKVTNPSCRLRHL